MFASNVAAGWVLGFLGMATARKRLGEFFLTVVLLGWMLNSSAKQFLSRAHCARSRRRRAPRFLNESCQMYGSLYFPTFVGLQASGVVSFQTAAARLCCFTSFLHLVKSYYSCANHDRTS